MAIKPLKPSSTGASAHQIRVKDKVTGWSQQHQLVAVETLMRLLRQPFGSIMTWLVIAIALTLPGAVWMTFDNLTQLSSRFQQSGSISVYLTPGTTDETAQLLEKAILGEEMVAKVNYISATQALDEFRRTSGLGDALDLLPENPLPGVIMVEPELMATRTDVQILTVKIEQDPAVDSVIKDDAWLNRLEALIALSERVVWVVSVLLAISIVLIVGNTIRMSIANRVDEIRVMKLVGATDAGVRRPFLYTGLWYGMIGGLMSWLVLIVGWLLISGPVRNLAELYASEFTLRPLSALVALLLLVSAMFLGWAGAWWSVVRHLGEIEP